MIKYYYWVTFIRKMGGNYMYPTRGFCGCLKRKLKRKFKILHLRKFLKIFRNTSI